MAWAFFGVLNAGESFVRPYLWSSWGHIISGDRRPDIDPLLATGVQILACMLAGWFCARLHLVEQEVLSRQLNKFAMLIAVPAFIIQFLGIKTDLRDPVAWR
jgi:hypothetical protein